MAERQEVGGALGRLDPGDPRDDERVSLRRLVGAQGIEGRRAGAEEALGGGGAERRLFGRDVDHPGASGLVLVGELSRHGRPRASGSGAVRAP